MNIQTVTHQSSNPLRRWHTEVSHMFPEGKMCVTWSQIFFDAWHVQFSTRGPLNRGGRRPFCRLHKVTKSRMSPGTRVESVIQASGPYSKFLVNHMQHAVRWRPNISALCRPCLLRCLYFCECIYLWSCLTGDVLKALWRSNCHVPLTGVSFI